MIDKFTMTMTKMPRRHYRVAHAAGQLLERARIDG